MYMGRIGEGRGGVVPWWDSRLGGGFQFFLGHGILNISSESLAQARSIGTLSEYIGEKGGSVDLSTSQRHKRQVPGCRVRQANGAEIHSKRPGLCQHEVISGITRKWKQCGAVQASCGCLVCHVCIDVRILVFAP